MKAKQLFTLSLSVLLTACLVNICLATPPRTKIPASITTPDKVKSKIGTLEFTDGYPTRETAALL
jgi:hypothetical protein